MKLLIAGGTGFVGRHLSAELLVRDHEVTVMSRRRVEPRPNGRTGDPARDPELVPRRVPELVPRRVMADISDPTSLAAALEGIDAAYYLVHSLDRADFVARDREGADAFGRAAAEAGVGRVIYLGALGDDGDRLSPHLRSRRDVEQHLADHVPTTTLRAGIVVGDGGTSWEILCQLVERLPIMLTPRWVQTNAQPIALADVVSLLAKALEIDVDGSDHFDIGTPEPLTYKQMLRLIADELRRSLFIVPVPVLSPSLSSHWLRLITDVDLQTARSLVDSMINEVVVTDRRLEALTGHRPMTFRTAARQALLDRRRRKASVIADDAA